jgi:hypothetical protein
MKARMAGMLALASAFAVGLAIQTSVVAQQPRKPDAKAAAEARRGGADPNIKQNRDAVLKEKPETQPPAPAEKTGEQSRQRVCLLVFDNYTNQWIDAYADGRYRGTVAPYGELATYVIAGPTVAYGSNAVYSWGPWRFPCNTSYVWQLTR